MKGLELYESNKSGVYITNEKGEPTGFAPDKHEQEALRIKTACQERITNALDGGHLRACA